ncbi:phosphotransferase [Nocardia thailandica]
MTVDTAVRPAWSELPRSLQSRIEDQLGARVTSAENRPGGFTHGFASSLLLADGRRVFAKAIETGDALAATFRTEAVVSASLPPGTPAPAVLWHADLSGWVVTVFENVPGRHPRFDDPRELAAVLATIDLLPSLLDPCPAPDVATVEDTLVPEMRCWTEFLRSGPPPDLNPWATQHLDLLATHEHPWVAHATGTALLHTDLRPDNLLRTPDGTVTVVDWASPCRGAPWIDLTAMIPSLLAASVDPDPILADHTDVPREIAVSFLIALAGFWEYRSRLPPPPRSPNLRRHQADSTHRLQQWIRRAAWPR